MGEVVHKSPAAGHVFVARQPIFDRHRRVFGYELLLEPASPGDFYATSAERTSARVISDALLAIGLDTLVGTRRAFVSVSRRLLLDGIPDVLPAARVALQLSSDIEADAEVVECCKALKAKGYTLAVDDFVLTPWTADLVPLAGFLKVNVDAIDAETRARLVTGQARNGPALIAKGVNSAVLFDALAGGGCTYFQGDFLGHPSVKQGRSVPGNQIVYLRLLRALNNSDLSVQQIEDLVKHDAALCHRILRTVNSWSFALKSTVTSIRDALLILGRDIVRRWASLWALAGLNERAHSELLLTATTRARFCEIAGGLAFGDDGEAAGFLLGMCSMFEALLERPMTEILADLPLDLETKGALLGHDSPKRWLLDCAVAYEHGRFDEAAGLARQMHIDPVRLPGAYADAMRWSRELERQRAA